MAHMCPACGYPALQESPRSAKGGGSFEICPSCGFQFGVSDDDAGFTYANWRARWKKLGAPWSSKGIPAPRGWNPESQVAGLKSGTRKPQKTAKRKSAS
jgi:hypothetical protein